MRRDSRSATSSWVHVFIYVIDRQFFFSRSSSHIIILRKYTYDLILYTYEFNEVLLEKMMISISSKNLTLSLFYFDEEIFAKLRNELKSNFRSLDIS